MKPGFKGLSIFNLFLTIIFSLSEVIARGILHLLICVCGGSYEPELHPGVTYRLKSPKACLKIFSTGSITVTGN